MIASLPDAPLYRCPGCGGSLARERSATAIVCPGCGHRYPVRDGVAALLGAEELCAHAPFIDHYRRVRRAERWEVEATAIASLPYPASGNPHAALWRRRAASYRALLRTLAARGPRLRILELGAGNCWLSWRLAGLGHSVEALDINDDPEHGLRAAVVLPKISGSLCLVHASLDRIPFADRQFDAVIAAASLHYARDLPGTVAEARRVLRPGGLLVLLDTPLYRDASVGELRVASQVQLCMSSVPAASGASGPGYIEVAALRASFRAAGLAYREVPVHGTLRATAGRIRRGLRSAARLPERATMPLVLGVRGC